MEIYLNLGALANASNEYIMATIYHEVVHARLYIQGYKYNEHHDIIFSKHRYEISKWLKLDFPSLTEDQANALAYGGLYEFSQWKVLEQRDIDNGSTKTQDWIKLNDEFLKSNGNGTHCK